MLTVVVALAGCGDDDESSGPSAQAKRPVTLKGTLVGKVDGSDAYVALVSDGKRVVGYVCDSKRVSGWIDEAAIRDAKVSLSSRGGDALGQATFTADGVGGELTIGGERRAFSAKPASGQAGLYRAARVRRQDDKLGNGEIEVGWVVLPDGSQRGGTNVGTTSTVLVKPAPRLAPSATNISISTAGNSIKLALTNVQGITLIPIP